MKSRAKSWFIVSFKPFLTVMIGNFNAKSKQWCKLDKTSFKDSQLQLLSSKFGLWQIITETTHILENSRSFIDLLFMSQPNIVLYSVVHASLYSHCHHQAIFAKFDWKVFYPPPYQRTVWDLVTEKEQLACLIGNQHSLAYMLMSKFLFLMIQSQILCQILRPSLDEPPYKSFYASLRKLS